VGENAWGNRWVQTTVPVTDELAHNESDDWRMMSIPRVGVAAAFDE